VPSGASRLIALLRNYAAYRTVNATAISKTDNTVVQRGTQERLDHAIARLGCISSYLGQRRVHGIFIVNRIVLPRLRQSYLSGAVTSNTVTPAF
jgi:hypothetical protein